MISWINSKKEIPVKNDIYLVFHNGQVKTYFYSEKGFAVSILTGEDVTHWAFANKPNLSLSQQ